MLSRGSSSLAAVALYMVLGACNASEEACDNPSIPLRPAKMDMPLRFKGGRESPNRFALASLTNGQSNQDGTLHEREAVWLERRAKGGYGVVNSCCVHVQANGKGWEGEWGCFGDQHIDGYRDVTERVHKHGGLFIVQIFHAGMRADDKLIEGPARSAVDTEYKHRGGTREVKGMSDAEVEQLIEDFVAAAKRVEAAGADGVEIHGAHGYILTQFLCPDLNTRTDKWGGASLENRARLTREVTRRIKAAVAKDFIVGIRLSAEPGYEKAGWNIDPDEALQTAKWAAEDGVDFVSLSVFGHCPSHVAKKYADGADAKPLVKLFREALPEDVVLMACGGVEKASDVRALLDSGVDFAVTGRTAIGTPDFPKQCVENPDYEIAIRPPFTEEHLASVDVSPPFIDFLRGWLVK